MRPLEATLPPGRRLLALDALVALWVVTWAVMGILVAAELSELADLSDTVGSVGEAAESSGAAIELLAGLPVVGDALGAAFAGPASDIQEAGRSAQESGADSRDTIETLTVLLGLSIGVIPSLPVLAGYLPARVARAREASALSDAARRAGDDPAFRELLARRAAEHLPYRRLAEISREPWRDLAEGRFDRLARAELERLGVEAPRGAPADRR